MSIQDVSWVLEESPATGNDRLVLIVVANHANKDHPWAFVSYETIAHEARVSRATAIRCMNRLSEVGAVEVRRSAGRRCNEYRLVKGQPSQVATDADDPEPSHDDPSTVAATVATEALNGRAAATRTVEPLEPEPELPSVAVAPKTTGTRLPDPFVVGEELWRWADEQQFSREWVRSETARFADYWRAVPGARGRKLDWPATWRNWLRTASERIVSRPGFAPRPNIADRNAENAAEALRLMGGTGR